MSDKARRTVYIEGELRDILNRAIQLDSEQGEALSEVDVYHIARELQISEASVTEALRERAHQKTSLEVADRESSNTRKSALPPLHAMPFFTAAAGALTPIVLSELIPLAHGNFLLGSSVGTFFCLQAAMTALATQYEGEAPHQRWQLANLTLWGGIAVGFGLMNQRAVPEFWPIFIGFAGLTALAGSAVIAVKEALRRREAAASGGSASSTWRRRGIRVLKRIAELFEGPTQLSRLPSRFASQAANPTAYN